MALNTNIPQTTQSLGFTQPLIQANFQFIDTQFAVNHIEFNSGANSGKHRFLQIPDRAATSSPAPTTAAQEVALFCETVNGQSQLFYRPANNATPYAITDGSLTETGGWTRFPNGLLLWWTAINMNGIATASVVFAVNNFPGFDGTFQNAQVTIDNPSATVLGTIARISAINNTGLTVTVERPAVGNIVYVQVIGKGA